MLLTGPPASPGLPTRSKIDCKFLFDRDWETKNYKVEFLNALFLADEDVEE